MKFSFKGIKQWTVNARIGWELSKLFKRYALIAEKLLEEADYAIVDAVDVSNDAKRLELLAAIAELTAVYNSGKSNIEVLEACYQLVLGDGQHTVVLNSFFQDFNKIIQKYPSVFWVIPLD